MAGGRKEPDYADSFERYRSQTTETTSVLIRSVLRYVASSPRARVIDIGCGTGRYALLLASGGRDEKRRGLLQRQIIGKLREAEVLLGQGASVVQVSRKLSVTEQTYYRWRREYGGVRVDQAEGSRSWRKRTGSSRGWCRSDSGQCDFSGRRPGKLLSPSRSHRQ